MRKVLIACVLTMALLMLMNAPSATAQPAAPALPVSAYPPDVATAWFALQLDLVRQTPGFSPPVASRAFGYSGVTLYEALVGGMPDYQSLAGQLNALEGLPETDPALAYHWPTVANSALGGITDYLFFHASERNRTRIENLYRQFARQGEATVDHATFSRSVSYGQDIADAIYQWSLTDGGHDGELRSFDAAYTPPAGEGLWTPTGIVNNTPVPALQPAWGNNRPFALASGAECAPPAPPAYSEDPASAFYAEAWEVYETGRHLSPEQRDIALFWSDDPGLTSTPPGHSMALLTQLLGASGYHLDLAAEAYARLGIALADSFIACWHTKFDYNLLRPVTYIHNVIDPGWQPLLNTPSFPEYPSGHSVQSAAAAEVLAAVFGDQFAFLDQTNATRGLAPRSFAGFTDFAEEAAISRLYGGIHFRAAIEQGLAQGRCIGRRVNALTFRSVRAGNT